MKWKGLGLGLISFLCSFIGDQTPEKGYYQFPLNPGKQNFLSGTMGELRTTHFHAGIDIKTGAETGWPIYAVADGYVSRIKVEAGGYGNALYIHHPNGTYSLYGHLDRYIPAITQYIRRKQYEKESFGVDLEIPKEVFPVKKGELIAYSGNTGSSAGPHLHFEIRDSYQRLLDPLQFGFDEIIDTQKPIIEQLILKTQDDNATVNGQSGYFQIPLVELPQGYTTDQSIFAKGKIAIELLAHDTQNLTSNKYGIKTIELFANKQLIYKQHIELLYFDLQREIQQHYDYSLFWFSGKKYYKLYLEPLNGLNIYPDKSKNGIITIEDEPIFIEINLIDAYNNTQKLNFTIIPGENKNEAITNYTFFNNNDWIISDHTLFVKTKLHSRNTTVYIKGFPFSMDHMYQEKTYQYFTWNLNEGLPDSVFVDESMVKFDFITQIPSETEFNYRNADFGMFIRKECLYDTLFVTFQKQIDWLIKREYFDFKNSHIPLRKSAYLTLFPKNAYNQEKASVYAVNKGVDFVGGKWENDAIRFSTTSMGKFTILEDTVPPQITLIKANASQIRFKIADQLSGIQDFTATLNGRWLCMYYDSKTKMIWSERLNENIPLLGEFRLEVTDQVNNKKTYQINLQ